MKRIFDFGCIDFENRGEARNRVTVEMEYEQDGAKKRFSVYANVWNTRHSDIVCGGQCLDTIAPYMESPVFSEIFRLWEAYRLNDMHPECEHQRAAGWDKLANKKVTLYHWRMTQDARKEQKAEEKAVTGENKAQNDTETVQDFSPITGYDDAFFIDRDNENVTWMYYNPDSNAGGQYVTSTLSFDEIKEAAKTHKSTDDFFDYLGSIADQTLADVGTEWFEEAENAFSQTPDYTECTPETMEALIETTERSDMVATNIGKVPIEDYREIVAFQNGFDNYDEMYNEGIRIGNGYDKEPEPIVPAWEKKKKEKVK